MSIKRNIGVPFNIITNATTLVKTGNGVLYLIVVNATAAGTISVYDGLNANGTLLGTLKSNISEGFYRFDCGFAKGLCIVTAAASNITVVYE